MSAYFPGFTGMTVGRYACQIDEQDVLLYNSSTCIVCMSDSSLGCVLLFRERATTHRLWEKGLFVAKFN